MNMVKFFFATLLHIIVNHSVADSIAERDSLGSEVQKITLEQAVAIARKNADSVMAARENVLAVQHEGRADLSFSYPQFRAQASYSRNFELTTVPFGPFGDIETGRDHDYRGSIHGEQLLWSFGKKTAIRDGSNARIAESEANLNIASREAAFQARIRVTNHLFSKARLTILEDRVRQRQEELEDAQDLRSSGLTRDLDVRQASINLLQAQNALKEGETQFSQSKFDLANSLTMEADRFEVLGDLERSEGIMGIVEQLKKNIEISSEILMLQAQIEREKAIIREVKASFLPDLNAVADASADGENVDELNDSWSAGFTVNWDLFSGGDRRSRKKAATYRIRRIQHRVLEVVRDRERQLNNLQVEWRDLEIRIRNEQKAVELASANYQDARDQYRAGLITLTRLGEVSLDVAEARFSYVFSIREEQLLGHSLLRLAEQ